METYESWCKTQGVGFERNESVMPPDETTLFTTSGMQKRKGLFKDQSVRGWTVGDVQTCLRTVDLDETGDGTHGLVFHMLGLFSFRDWPLERGMGFWLGFLDQVGLKPDQITVHPDKKPEMFPMWERQGRGGLLTLDEGCKWSDGEIGGYCTEMHLGGVEIGNIVNPLGDCLDCGFGLERIGLTLGITKPTTEEEELLKSIEVLGREGLRPGGTGRSYVMRRILRRMVKRGLGGGHPMVESEKVRLERLKTRYGRLLPKNPGKSREWWLETHGVDIDEVGGVD